MHRIAYPLLVIALTLNLTGCHPEKNDSHTEVFKTPEQTSIERRTQLLKSHQDLAITLLKFTHPDVQAKAADTGVLVEADGVQKQIDVAPLENELEHHAGNERLILGSFLQQQMRPFDQQRLDTLGFPSAKPLLHYQLINRTDLDRMEKDYPRATICSGPIVPELYHVTMVTGHGPTTAVDQATLKAWHVSQPDLDAAMMTQLRQTITQAGPNLFDTINYPTFGDCGTLKVDAAVILLPEFLKTVQEQWKTKDDLVIFLPSTASVEFVASKNQKLLGLLDPQWKQLITSLPDPLYKLLLLRKSDSLGAFVFTPATKPAAVTSKPTTKKREPYIVN